MVMPIWVYLTGTPVFLKNMGFIASMNKSRRASIAIATICVVFSPSSFSEETKVKMENEQKVDSELSDRDGETKEQEVKIGAIPNDEDNYISDKIRFSYPLPAMKIDFANSGSVENVCVPRKSKMRGVGKRVIDGKNHTIFIAYKIFEGSVDNGCEGSVKLVKRNDVLAFENEFLGATHHERFGWTFGSLMVPYKYHVSGDKGFSGGATLGGYLGYRFDRTVVTGFETQLVGFAGAAAVPVVTNVDGVSSTETLAGASYGLGVLVEVKGTFQMGLVFGKDRVDDSSGYERNGKKWVAVALGFEFRK